MAINEIPFHGNIIPLTWFHHLERPGNKPHLLAIVILSDIIYWYRPQELRDEESGDFLGWRSKFKGDMLQRSYDQIATRLGVTKWQAKEGIDYLIDEGLIRREFRTITSHGKVLNNCMFIEPIPEGIRRINELPKGDSAPSSGISQEGVVGNSSGVPPQKNLNTNTESTCSSTEISLTTKISKNGINHPSMSAEPKKDEPEQTGMDGWMDEYQNPKFIFLMGCDVMDINTIRELMVLPLETLQNQWAIVKNSTKINDKPGMLVTNLRKLVKLEVAKQRAAAERAANPEAAQTPTHAHADANRYQRPDFITEAEWDGLSDIPAVYELLDGATFDEMTGSLSCRTPRHESAFFMKHNGAEISQRFAAIRNWWPDGDE